MDPILLFFVGLVVFFFLAFVVTLVLWFRATTREISDCRLTIAFLINELQEKSEYSRDWSVEIDNLVNFVLAYYKRTRARGKKKEPANAAMALHWRKLPKDTQEKLGILGGLANLRVGDNPSS